MSKRPKNKFFFNWEHTGFKNLWTSQEFNSIKPLDIRVSKQTRQVLVTQFPEKLSLSYRHQMYFKKHCTLLMYFNSCIWIYWITYEHAIYYNIPKITQRNSKWWTVSHNESPNVCVEFHVDLIRRESWHTQLHCDFTSKETSS